MNPNRSNFLQLNSVITGFSPFKLEGTGLIDIYQDLIEKALGAKETDFYTMIRDVLSVPTIDEREDKVARPVNHGPEQLRRSHRGPPFQAPPALPTAFADIRTRLTSLKGATEMLGRPTDFVNTTNDATLLGQLAQL